MPPSPRRKGKKEVRVMTVFPEVSNYCYYELQVSEFKSRKEALTAKKKIERVLR